MEKKNRGLDVDPGSYGEYEPGRSYFLGIGIDEYRDSRKWGTLHNAVKDVVDIKNVLVDKYGIDKVELLLDRDATGDNILDAFTRLIEEVKSNDKVIIYYSGHGHYDALRKTG